MRNESLVELDGLVGHWKLTITNAWFLDSLDVKVHGDATIQWIGDAFIHLHATFADDSTWDGVIGRSDANEQLTVLYHDDRGVCRVFDMAFDSGKWSMLREDPTSTSGSSGRSRATGSTRGPRRPRTAATPGARTST